MSKVLVVDDEPDILGLLQVRLRHAGYRVVRASNGAEALAVVEERGMPDIAVLDVSMPEMTGLELLRRLRAMQGGDRLKAIFLSARVLPEDIAAGQALGARYLTKPFVASALLAAVNQCMPQTADAGSW